VIASLGGSVTSVIFRVNPQVANISIYQMEAGEIGKLNGVAYA
jgi:hypothetical protein